MVIFHSHGAVYQRVNPLENANVRRVANLFRFFLVVGNMLLVTQKNRSQRSMKVNKKGCPTYILMAGSSNSFMNGQIILSIS
jgi:hypothetical protein